MKISVEEVSRLLAYTPQERNTGRTALADEAIVERSTIGSEAAVVEVSATAQEVQRIKRLVNAIPDVREARIRELKAQIENGTYNVSGEDIADLIIRRTLADNTAL